MASMISSTPEVLAISRLSGVTEHSD